MRERKEIEEDVRSDKIDSIFPTLSIVKRQEIQIELLLDIRELLQGTMKVRIKEKETVEPGVKLNEPI